MQDLLLALLGVSCTAGLGLGVLAGVAAAGRPARVEAFVPEAAPHAGPVFSTVSSTGWVRPQA